MIDITEDTNIWKDMILNTNENSRYVETRQSY